VNKFQNDAESSVTTLRIDPSIEPAQVERLRATRAKRDSNRVNRALDQVEQAASGSENLLPRILEAVESYATVGEISGRLRSVWGEYREASTV
jgi:methylmalonyl-CoA mutase N-terminal domain/subunit